MLPAARSADLLSAPPPTAPVIRIALVEDDVNFQNNLADALRVTPDLRLHHVASTRAGGLAMLVDGARPADVLLVDLGLPDGSGIDVIRTAHAQWPMCNVMVCTTFGDEAHVIQSIESGAAGYLLKDSSPERLVAEIRSLHAGGSPISPLIARQILRRFHPAPSTPAPEIKGPGGTLSSRETQVLELITKGFTTQEIAALLAVSHYTVMTYVRRIYTKLEVKSRTEAVYEARNQGLGR